MKHIRNFSIIAHIDHGKSTLADRLLEMTGTIPKRKLVEQVLDRMDLEREKGITIKAKPVRMVYKKDGVEYELNLIDTPGHVDFSYEVSRALSACEGALLLVDATQGIEAQTMANAHLAMELGLTIIPIINKIDLPSANPELVSEEIENTFLIPKEEIILTSAKEGIGIKEVLDAIVERIPPPKGDPNKPLAALIFDAVYDSYLGVLAYLRIFDGKVKAGDKIKVFSTGREFEVTEVGIFTPGYKKINELQAGEVGYLAASIKEIGEFLVGDTITLAKNPVDKPVPGFKRAQPMVFCGFYPLEGGDYEELKDALSKLRLNDASLVYSQEVSEALGFGFRVGFLGLLHMEITQERLEREFGLKLIKTIPNVVYEILLINGEILHIENPSELPSPEKIEEIREPYIKASILTPPDFIGPLMELANERRGKFINMEYLDAVKVLIEYELPLNEIIIDFYDRLKSRSRGYASFDYEYIGYRPSNLVKIDILLNGIPVDALSFMIHKDKAYIWGRRIIQKLRKVIPRQLFDVSIQAAIGKRVIARETVKALRKDVTAKCYGGDITRKRKLLEKQKEGKKRMKKIGRIEIPQEAFLAVLDISDDKK